MPLRFVIFKKMRKRQLLDWILSGDVSGVKFFRENRGCAAGAMILIADGGKDIPITQYLEKQGFKDGDVIKSSSGIEYTVKFQPRGQYPESFVFLRKFVAKPIAPPPFVSEIAELGDDGIPF